MTAEENLERGGMVSAALLATDKLSRFLLVFAGHAQALTGALRRRQRNPTRWGFRRR
jgi:hypothetical protein